MLPYKTIIQHNDGIIPRSISEDQFNNIDWFTQYCSENFLNSITYLPPEQHWNKDILFFGNYDSNSITISYEDHQIREIYCRIDTRSTYMEIVNKINNTIQLGSLIAFNDSLKIIGNTEHSLLDAIEECSEYTARFFKERISNIQ
ncbi:unnamed protein product [Commensalibacter communis]|uniref:Uncharacterized protein n=1 Tax=Commensalibacter communis TaxID=2972786 RepID=A0A9W4XDM9_9PROT|nr:hypothetical protein [Commensalibacter communis]CAI3949660.1 unnamed protein product [Commensalibacter communis]CAI3953408.1 unnamed protein product [Commensalibacter communis]CAI3953675.1 unnamed protein product [Commensalibacter communis]CAI3953745.1 unnamed protein product [Commensalibacter communis]CAI3956021.1 unnamed protein product [Commensalibacter communis]